MTAAELRESYGVLERDAGARIAFLRDAEALLSAIGDELQGIGLVKSHAVRQALSSQGYAGEVFGYFRHANGHNGVMVSLNHLPDEIFQRPDGISGYAQYRRLFRKGKRAGVQFEPQPSEVGRIPLHGLNYYALLAQVRNMLEHPALEA